MDRVLFGSGMMMVSMNGNDPCGCVPSAVNLMALPIEFVSHHIRHHSYLFQGLGGLTKILVMLMDKDNIRQ